MTRKELITEFYNNHQSFVHYINSLPEDKFVYSYQDKWTAGQQLSHIHLCLQPINQALASKEFILQKFGKIDRPLSGYDEIISNYKTGLEKGGKAPQRFVPGLFDPSNKNEVSAAIVELLQSIQQQLESYTDEELDTLVLPHPILGMLTIREMFYLMTYHATHHHLQTAKNLEGFGDN